MNARRLTKGLSLLEILIVVALAGILLTTSAYALNNYVSTLRLRNASQELASTLERVSSTAAAQSRGFELEIKSNHTLIWSTTSDKKEVGNLTLANNAVVEQKPAGKIGFSGRGLPLQQYVFEVSRDSKKQAIVLFPTGMVVVQ